MTDKFAINLDPPMPASDDCLPHAAMTLGSIRGNGTRPRQALVSRIVIQEMSPGNWTMIRLDSGGGFIGDTAHASKADAIQSARDEFRIGDELVVGR